MRAHRASWTVLSFALASCGVDDLPPEGQVVLHVATDAPLPLALGQVPPDSHAALFDRLSFEVFPAGASEPCDACFRAFEVDQAMFHASRASVGIVSATPGVRVRVRLFRGNLDAPSPRDTSTIESVVLLPAVGEGDVRHLTVELWTEEVGRPRGSIDDPAHAAKGRPVGPLAGSWRGSLRQPCEGEAGSEEVCVPGGGFWMGDPRLDLAGAPEYQGANERLVLLSSFFLDRNEVTVRAFRASGLAERLGTGKVYNPQPASAASLCTYEEHEGANEGLPVNCLTWRLARAYCEKQGKRLPTEAELAYASSALGTASFVWGEKVPSCGEAVFGQGGACGSSEVGSSVVGSGTIDRLPLPSGELVDLAGNVMEFASDFWQLDAEPCWKGSGVLTDPRCDAPSSMDRVGRSVRGGHFADPPMFLRAALRTSIEGESKAVSDRVGFRCARDGV
jgi:sulfatase modifying factor 1